MDFCGLKYSGNPKGQCVYYYSALQPKDCTHHTPYSTDFGVIKIEHPIASGGCAPQTPCFRDYIQNPFTASCYNAETCVMLHSSIPECQIMCTNST